MILRHLASTVFTVTFLATTAYAAGFQAMIEADYALQADLRNADATPNGHMAPERDAAGGCDGVRNGEWGFHTGLDDKPWWQVDLGKRQPIERAVIWNRCDGGMASRARNLMLLLSDDGAAWRTVYTHDGTVFGGLTDNNPLVISLGSEEARFVRVQLPERNFLHLDEVEVFGPRSATVSLARRGKPSQSSSSQWSNESRPETSAASRLGKAELRRRLQDRARLLADPLLDFDAILFTKRVPGSFTHMSDQYLGWWSRPGGGIYILRDFKSDNPTEECITESFTEPGTFLRPMLSYDGTRVLFAWCKYYPEVAGEADKLDKANIPEDAFFHLYEMNIDGTKVRQITHGKYNDFDARYLPDGRIVFLSTRRGHTMQAGRKSAALTLAKNDLPECYVRCGGGPQRPCAVYTLHTIDRDGTNLTAISPFEMFEWTPSIAHDGTILYSRWDYIDRDNMPFMSLWAINPDGANPRIVYGNYTHSPHCTFEPMSIPNSKKIIFTATGHHSHTIGSLVLLDPAAANEGAEPITRLTPEVVFPEIEGWPRAFYANPWPLSERLYLTAWGPEPSARQGGARSKNGMGLYLYDAETRQLELLYRDPEISSAYPIPLIARRTPPVLASTVNWEGPQEGTFLLLDVQKGLKGVSPGDVKAIRIIAVPPKTHPTMNFPALGLTKDDPGKCVLGTVPVEADGSAHFRAPSGVSLFFQALDGRGCAIQTMRSATHVQPGQQMSCIGCHENRQTAPAASQVLAARRRPSKIAPGPEGSWPLRYDQLVQPVLDAKCVSCHAPGKRNPKLDLTGERSYETLTRYGKPSLYDHVMARYKEGRSTEGACAAATSPLLTLLEDGHQGVELSEGDLERFIVWMDAYAQRLGSFSDEQEEELRTLKQEWAALLAKRR